MAAALRASCPSTRSSPLAQSGTQAHNSCTQRLRDKLVARDLKDVRRRARCRRDRLWPNLRARHRHRHLLRHFRRPSCRRNRALPLPPRRRLALRRATLITLSHTSSTPKGLHFLSPRNTAPFYKGFSASNTHRQCPQPPIDISPTPFPIPHSSTQLPPRPLHLPPPYLLHFVAITICIISQTGYLFPGSGLRGKIYVSTSHRYSRHVRR